MTDLLEWVRSRFQHPLIFILFVFGAVLLLMGIGQELPWSDKSALIADEPFERYGSLVIGSIFIVLAVVLMYRPPKGWVRPGSEFGKRAHEPHDFTPAPLPAVREPVPFTSRRAALSRTQKRLLAYIEGERRTVLDAIKRESGITNDAELYYRLEQLRLLGFIDSEKIEHGSGGEVIVVYRLSDAYLAVQGDIEEDSTVSVPTRSVT